MISNITPYSLPQSGFQSATEAKGNFSSRSNAAVPIVGEENSASVSQQSTLTDEEKAAVEKLKKIDQDVRAHEAAHKNVGGQFAGSASYTYQSGPDGKRYAVGGEVPIDVSPIEGDPEATIAKLDVVINAALAATKPSAQDRKIAASAVAARNQARAELSAQKNDKNDETVKDKILFDINNFGGAPKESVQEAYNFSLQLNQNTPSTGNNISVIS